jgi:hypothetical protein
MPAALHDFQRQLDQHYGRRPRAADARRRLRARLRDQGWSDDAIDALEDYFHEWSASHTDMIMADPAVEADPDRSGAPLTNGPGQTADGNHSAGLQFDWFQAAARGFMNASAQSCGGPCFHATGSATAYEGFAIDWTNSKWWCTVNGTTWGPNSGDNPTTNTGGFSTAGWRGSPVFIMWGGGDVGDAGIISTTTFHFTIPTGFHGLELMLNWPRIGFAWGALALCLSVALELAQRLDHRYVVSALAQSCGPDPAPSQATNAGFTCETFRWGDGDTANEIDAAQTYQLGYKFYWGTANLDGHVTVASDYSALPNGKIVTQTSVPADHDDYVLNTCGGPPSSNVWTVGNFFQHGWYIEFVGEWNATGFSGVQTGFNGSDSSYTVPLPPGTGWEIDNPDAFGFRPVRS